MKCNGSVLVLHEVSLGETICSPPMAYLRRSHLANSYEAAPAMASFRPLPVTTLNSEFDFQHGVL